MVSISAARFWLSFPKRKEPSSRIVLIVYVSMAGSADNKKSADVWAKLPALFAAAQQGASDKFEEVATSFSVKDIAELRGDKSRSLLHYAAVSGSVDLCRLLLDKFSCDLHGSDSEGTTLLMAAASSSSAELVQFLLDRGADATAANKHGDQAIHHAAASGNSQVIEVLLKHGSDINAPSSMGTPLCWAAAAGRLDCIHFLVGKGAALSSSAIGGVHPLAMAIFRGHVEVVQALLTAGADPRQASQGGINSLHAAAALQEEASAVKIIDALLKAGADPDAADGEGHTPLMLAAFLGRRQAAAALLPHSAAIPGVEPWSVEGLMAWAEAHRPTGPGGPAAATATASTSTQHAPLIPDPEEPDEELAAKFKQLGDEAFRSSDFASALSHYTTSLRHRTSNHLVWANRSAALGKLGRQEEALADAQRSRALQPDYAKAWYREAQAHEALGDWTEAACAYFEASQRDPSNGELSRCLKRAIDEGRKDHQMRQQRQQQQQQQ